MPIMKWDGAAYLEDVRRHLRSMNCLHVRAMITDGKKTKEIADYLKSVNKNHGGSGYGDVSMYNNTSSCIELKYNKALNDEGARTLTITWNQAAREIMRMFEEGAMHDPEEEPMQEQALKPGDDIEYDVDTSHFWGKRLTFDELRQMTGELVIVNDFWFPDDTKELDGEGEVLLVINADEDAVTLRRSPTETVTIERGDMDEIDSRKDCTAVWNINSEKEEETSMNEDKTTVIVSEDYTRAVALTRSIIANAQAAQQSLYEVCKGLKEMRDGKLYKELGYANFEDYTENEVGIKRHMAQKYIAIADMENGESIHHFEQIGVTKLSILAKLDEPTREAVTESVDVEFVTVKELKAQIDALKQERDSKDKLLAVAKEEVEKLEASKAELYEQLLESHNVIFSLDEKVQELEDRPVEHAVMEDTESREELERVRGLMEQQAQGFSQKEMEIEDRIRKEYESKLKEAAKPGKNDRYIKLETEFRAYQDAFQDIVDRLTMLLEDTEEYEEQSWREACLDKLETYFRDNLLYLRSEV